MEGAQILHSLTALAGDKSLTHTLGKLPERAASQHCDAQSNEGTGRIRAIPPLGIYPGCHKEEGGLALGLDCES